jgi:hypothetical protein
MVRDICPTMLVKKNRKIVLLCERQFGKIYGFLSLITDIPYVFLKFKIIPDID